MITHSSHPWFATVNQFRVCDLQFSWNDWGKCASILFDTEVEPLRWGQPTLWFGFRDVLRRPDNDRISRTPFFEKSWKKAQNFRYRQYGVLAGSGWFLWVLWMYIMSQKCPGSVSMVEKSKKSVRSQFLARPDRDVHHPIIVESGPYRHVFFRSSIWCHFFLANSYVHNMRLSSSGCIFSTFSINKSAPWGNFTSIYKKNHQKILKTKKVRAKSSSENFRDEIFRNFSRSKNFDFFIENCMKNEKFWDRKK